MLVIYSFNSLKLSEIYYLGEDLNKEENEVIEKVCNFCFLLLYKPETGPA